MVEEDSTHAMEHYSVIRVQTSLLAAHTSRLHEALVVSRAFDRAVGSRGHC